MGQWYGNQSLKEQCFSLIKMKIIRKVRQRTSDWQRGCGIGFYAYYRCRCWGTWWHNMSSCWIKHYPRSACWMTGFSDGF